MSPCASFMSILPIRFSHPTRGARRGSLRTVPSIAVLCLLFTSPFAIAREAEVTTRNGLSYEGKLVSEDVDTVRLRTANGILVTLQRSNIKTFEYRKPPAQEFKERRAALEDSDLEGRYKLANWAIDKNEFALVKNELKKMAKAFPDDGRIPQLLQIAIEREKLTDKQGHDDAKTRDLPRPDRNTKSTRPTRPTRPTPSGNSPELELEGEPELLDKKAIDLIKIWEMPPDISRSGVSITIPQDVLNDLLSDYSSNNRTPKGVSAQRAFRRANGTAQLQLIFDLQAREYYDKVIVRGDPPVFQQFRRDVNRSYIEPYFRELFASGSIPRLYLFPTRRNPVNAGYTNFYILSQFATADSAMIERDRPEESLLLQWGLPRQDAKFPAPDVPGWRPFFRGMNDPSFRRYVAWIRTLYPRPEYGIDYKTPRFLVPEEAEESDGETEGTAAGDASSGG